MMFSNNNKALIKKLTYRTLKAGKIRNEMVILVCRQSGRPWCGRKRFIESLQSSRVTGSKNIIDSKRSFNVLGKRYFLIAVFVGLLLFSLVGCCKTPSSQGQLTKPPVDMNNKENIKNSSANISSDKTIYEKDKVKGDWKETVVINDCSVKNGPGKDYSNIGILKYGDTILLKGSYNGWFLAETNNIIEFWIEGKNVADYDYNNDNKLFGVVTAENVKLERINLNKGNLVWILKKDTDRAYVRPVAIDIIGGYSGWINDTDFTMDKKNVYFNQAFLKIDTKVYKESNEKSNLNSDFNLLSESGGNIFINKVQDDGWVCISAFGGIDGWVKSTDIYLP